MTNTEPPRTVRDLTDRRQVAWNALQSFETALITAPDSPALAQAIADKRREIRVLSNLIRTATRRVAQRDA